MKKSHLYILLAICFIAMACQQTKEKYPQLPEDVESLYIVEFNNALAYYEIIDDSLAIDTNFVRINGVAEIDKSFDMKVIKRFVHRRISEYRHGETRLPDTIRAQILQTINEFDRDSTNYREDYLRLYSGDFYFILIKKNDGKIINLAGIPDAISASTKEISVFMRDSTHNYTNIPITNNDSIKEYLRNYEVFLPEYLNLVPMPNLPIKKGYENPYY